MGVSLISPGAASLVLDDHGHAYLRHGDVHYRLRYYEPDEWAALPRGRRPVVFHFDPEFECWVGLEPALPSDGEAGRWTR